MCLRWCSDKWLVLYTHVDWVFNWLWALDTTASPLTLLGMPAVAIETSERERERKRATDWTWRGCACVRVSVRAPPHTCVHVQRWQSEISKNTVELCLMSGVHTPICTADSEGCSGSHLTESQHYSQQPHTHQVCSSSPWHLATM